MLYNLMKRACRPTINFMVGLFKILKIIFTTDYKLQLEEEKIRRLRKECIHKLMLQYLESIKDTHEFNEIKEQLKSKRKFYERYRDLYITDPITGYINGTSEYDIINILEDIKKGHIKPFNIILTLYIILSIFFIVLFSYII